jgi:amino acid permease
MVDHNSKDLSSMEDEEKTTSAVFYAQEVNNAAEPGQTDRGLETQRHLKSRQMSMIAIGGAIGMLCLTRIL